MRKGDAIDSTDDERAYTYSFYSFPNTVTVMRGKDELLEFSKVTIIYRDMNLYVEFPNMTIFSTSGRKKSLDHHFLV